MHINLSSKSVFDALHNYRSIMPHLPPINPVSGLLSILPHFRLNRQRSFCHNLSPSRLTSSLPLSRFPFRLSRQDQHTLLLLSSFPFVNRTLNPSLTLKVEKPEISTPQIVRGHSQTQCNAIPKNRQHLKEKQPGMEDERLQRNTGNLSSLRESIQPVTFCQPKCLSSLNPKSLEVQKQETGKFEDEAHLGNMEKIGNPEKKFEELLFFNALVTFEKMTPFSFFKSH
jgi:hypothetical protein